MARELRRCDANSRPAVIPKLSALPADPGKRDAILDQSQTTDNPESHAALKPKERKAVTAAAYAAALIGQMFSTTENVTLGVATSIDSAPAPAGDLVPWVKLTPP